MGVGSLEVVGMTESAEPKLTVSEFITSKITDKNLNENNYLQ